MIQANPPLPVRVGEHLTCQVSGQPGDDHVTLRFDVTLPVELLDTAAGFNEKLAPLLDAVEHVTTDAWAALEESH